MKECEHPGTVSLKLLHGQEPGLLEGHLKVFPASRAVLSSQSESVHNYKRPVCSGPSSLGHCDTSVYHHLKLPSTPNTHSMQKTGVCYSIRGPAGSGSTALARPTKPTEHDQHTH